MQQTEKSIYDLAVKMMGIAKTTHYINFSNNLLRISGLKANIAHHASLKICKSNSIIHNTLTFINSVFLPTRELYLSGVEIS